MRARRRRPALERNRLRDLAVIRVRIEAELAAQQARAEAERRPQAARSRLQCAQAGESGPVDRGGVLGGKEGRRRRRRAGLREGRQHEDRVRARRRRGCVPVPRLRGPRPQLEPLHGGQPEGAADGEEGRPSARPAAPARLQHLLATMFEIGTSLREARVRQGLEFAELEHATKIRGKYLRALEDEEFELLPAQTYVKGFLRTYAEYLGLDGQLYVDEYNSRYVAGEDENPLRSRSQPPAHERRLATRLVLAVVAGIAVVVALVIAAWKFGGSNTSARWPAASSSAGRSSRDRSRSSVARSCGRGSTRPGTWSCA